MARPIMLLAGAAPGLGESLAATFAGAGYDVVGLARTERVAAAITSAVQAAGGAYTHRLCDLTQPETVRDALGPLADDIDVLIYNAHALLIKPFADVALTEFEAIWRVCCGGAFTVSQLVLPGMLQRGRGTILISGATASIRGSAKFAAFASAKFALRGLAQAMARELGPKGVHVAHVVLDGAIDEPQTEQRFGAASGQRMAPAALAEAYLGLTRQPQTTWTHELDIRTSTERF